MKRFIIVILVLVLSASVLAADDLIDPGPSNQRVSTMGFERNELDYLIDPLGAALFMESPTLFFALDGWAGQFGADLIGNGFRGGWGGALGGLGATAVVNYINRGDYFSEPAAENTTYDYQTYDDVTGEYATIIEDVVSTAREVDSDQEAIVHLGVDVGIPVALQILWSQGRFKTETLDYNNEYSNTPTPVAGALTFRNDRVHEVVDLHWGNRSNQLVFEPEISLEFGNLISRISLGAGLVNLLGPTMYEETWTQYDVFLGVDDTLVDRETVQTYDGWYYWDGANPWPSFSMSTVTLDPATARYIALNLATDNRLLDVAGGTLELPVTFMYNLYPGDRETVDTLVTTDYNDGSDPPLLQQITTVTTTTTLDSILDVGGEAGARYRRTFEAGDAVSVHLGAGLMIEASYDKETKSQEEVTAFQQDNDGDELFTVAGTDFDTVSRLYGYSIDVSEFAATCSVDIPIAVSFHPIPLLDFHAGTTTTLEVEMTVNQSSQIGTAALPNEEYTDNLVPANDFTDAPSNNSNTQNVPNKDTTTQFTFGTVASFGITLHLSESLKIDAIGPGGPAGLDSFSLTAIWNY